MIRFSDAEGLMLELLSALSGPGTTHREPSAGNQGQRRSVTRENLISGALSFSRYGNDDPGPEIAYALFIGNPVRAGFPVTRAVAYMRSKCGSIAKRNEGMLPVIAEEAYVRLVARDVESVPVFSGVKRRDGVLLFSVSVGFYWNAAFSTLRRAALNFVR